MDFKKLTVFCRVYEYRSFSEAAKQTHLTQPSVSGYIASLEEELGTRLFDRKGRKVKPTQTGNLFYKYARRILSIKEEAENEINLFLGRKKGELKLGGSTIPGQYVLPKFLGKFKSFYPNVKISLRIGDTKHVINMLLQDEIEIGVVGAKIPEAKLNFIPFARDELVLAIPTNYFLEKKEKISLDTLKSLPFILREIGSGTRITIERFLAEKGIDINQMNVIAELGSTEAVRQAVIAGMGVSILSKRALEVELKAGLIKILPLNNISLWRDFYLVYPKQKTLSPFTQAFLDFALEFKEKEK
ncbi:MAG: LysR family transcriptional regulator [Candidatus Desulfofervidaceae bacterium]|nr:LysR family transcriptional regulator [Candidatus Desulfofervidaceae bacterium]